MSKRRAQVSTEDFVTKYIPLQQQGMTREEIATELGMVDSEGKFDGFNTKLSNAKLELFVGTCQFKTPKGVVGGADFAVSYREVLRARALEAAQKADYSKEDDAEAALETALEKAGRITTLEAMREIRTLVENGELVPENAEVKRNTPGGICELPQPKGGRKGRDLASLGDVVAGLLAN